MEAGLGIIGGSGLYELPGPQGPKWRRVESPWGEPSDDILFAELDGPPLRFLPRHGRGHRLSPTDDQVTCAQNGDETELNDVPETVDEYARDVAAFLMWAAEPHMVNRKAMGLTVMVFLIVLAGLVYYTKKVWPMRRERARLDVGRGVMRRN